MKNSAASPPVDRADLEFPDWNGMQESPERPSPDTALAWIEACAAMFPEAVRRCGENRPTPVPVEFVL